MSMRVYGMIMIQFITIRIGSRIFSNQIGGKINMLKANDKIKVHLFDADKEIITNNFDAVFTVRKENGNLGIDWNQDKEDTFTPFQMFASSVIFENMDTGKKYHWNTIARAIIEV